MLPMITRLVSATLIQPRLAYLATFQLVVLLAGLLVLVLLDRQVAQAESAVLVIDQHYIGYDPFSALSNGGGTLPALYKANQQWAFKQTRVKEAQTLSRGRGMVVAIIDTGVRASHPDLKSHLLPGYNVLTNDADSADDNGHGTFIAGLIAQIAPDSKILPVKALTKDGSGTVANVAVGIRWAVNHGAKVISLSLGTYLQFKELEEAIAYARDIKGALIVASAGNDNVTIPRYPASYDRVFNAAASNFTNRKADFSNYGLKIRGTAPGTGLYSMYYLGGYAYGDGTSFSTPQVAALAALIWAQNPTRSNDSVKALIENNTFNLANCDPTFGSQLGAGLIDHYQALGGGRRPILNVLSCGV